MTIYLTQPPEYKLKIRTHLKEERQKTPQPHFPLLLEKVAV